MSESELKIEIDGEKEEIEEKKTKFTYVHVCAMCTSTLSEKLLAPPVLWYIYRYCHRLHKRTEKHFSD